MHMPSLSTFILLADEIGGRLKPFDRIASFFRGDAIDSLSDDYSEDLRSTDFN